MLISGSLFFRNRFSLGESGTLGLMSSVSGKYGCKSGRACLDKALKWVKP